MQNCGAKQTGRRELSVGEIRPRRPSSCFSQLIFVGGEMNRGLLIIATWILSGTLLAQESPTTPIARQLRTIRVPKIELARESLTIITWTTNNPVESPVHYIGVNSV